MFIMRLLVLVLVLLVSFYGGYAITENHISHMKMSPDICAGTYIRGITLDMISRWEKQKKYAVVRFQRFIPITYSLGGVPQEPKEFKVEGGAWVVGRGIISVSHMVDSIEQGAAIRFLATDLQARQIISDVVVRADNQWFRLVYEDFTIGGADKIQLKTVDKKYHLAYFELSVDLPDPYSFAIPLGRYSDLSVGSSIFIGGNPFNLGTSFRSGDVSSIKKSNEKLEMQDAPVPESYYLINLPIVWGDSGHPVYAITPCGDAEVVGMAFVIPPGFNYADLRFVLDVEFIRLFAVTNGVELDELQKKYKAWRLAQ